MSEKNVVQGTGSGDPVLERAKDFWERNNKPILIVCAIIILLGGGWLVYKNFFQKSQRG